MAMLPPFPIPQQPQSHSTPQTPSTSPHIVPGSPISQFLSRTQANLTAQADAEPVMPPQAAPAPVTTFWPADLNVVTAAEVVVNEPEAARFPVEPVINTQFEAESQTQIENAAQPEIGTPVKRGPGRPRNEMYDEIKAQEEKVRQLYSVYLNLCQERKAAAMAFDIKIADALASHAGAKSILRQMKRDAC